MASRAHLEGNKRHQEKLDRIVFYVEKGGKEKIKDRVKEVGAKSINAYIVSLIEADTGKLNSSD